MSFLIEIQKITYIFVQYIFLFSIAHIRLAHVCFACFICIFLVSFFDGFDQEFQSVAVFAIAGIFFLAGRKTNE